MNFIKYEQKDAIAVLTIDREKALNALNSEVLNELDATIDAIDLNAVRCLVITGAGQKSFVAGADIGEMSTLSKAEGEAFGKKGNDVFRKIEKAPDPCYRSGQWLRSGWRLRALHELRHPSRF